MIKTGARFTLGRNIGLAEGGITKTATGKKKKKKSYKRCENYKSKVKITTRKISIVCLAPGRTGKLAD